RVRNVASLVYASSPVAADLAEALAVGGLELLRAGNKQGAAKLADDALRGYAPAGEGERPPLRSAVIALAVALGKNSPKQGEARVQGVVATIPDRAVRGQAQLVLFRARLAASKQVVEESAVGKVDPETLSHQLAREELARHNIPFDSGWAKVIRGWPEPQRAF